jgi:2-polyprenyl-3-methyl-5-hydroxy-6-metoxy-1,4-benzoquinol methylase
MRAALVVTRRPCPLCGGRQARHRWEEDGTAYARCVACGAFFTDVEEHRYEAARHNVWDDEAPSADSVGFYGDARARAHATLLARCPPFGAGRLLDVGCGMGFFLERASAAGWECWGCEPSPAWAAIAERRLGRGRVFRGPLEQMPSEDRRFDLVTAWDVLEHIFDPVPFLRRTAALLAPGGRVFLRTPNLTYALPVYRARRRLGHASELGPMNHVVYFTATTLRRALRAAGLTPERWLTLPPPQVSTFETEPQARYAPPRSAVVAAKNAWAVAANAVVRSSAGRLALGADLDVIARAGGPPP